MSEEVSGEPTKAAEHERITELNDDQLDGALGGASVDPQIQVGPDEPAASRLARVIDFKGNMDFDKPGDD